MRSRAVHVPIDDRAFTVLSKRAKDEHVPMAELFRRAVERELGVTFTPTRKTAKPFTPWENRFIKQNLDILGPTEVAKHLDRLPGSVMVQAYRLGIRKRKTRKTTIS